MNAILPVPLIEREQLTELVEQKRTFNFCDSELNIYETRKVVHDFSLRFRGFTITSMLRGEKIAHMPDEVPTDYHPGHSIFTPSYKTVGIDFPKASFATPTQCMAFSLDDDFVNSQLAYFNDIMGEKAFSEEWSITDAPMLVKNNEELVSVLERISHLVTHPDPYADVQLRILSSELLLSVIKMQNRKNLIKNSSAADTNGTPLNAVLSYIRSNVQHEISMEDLFRLVSMSKSAFYEAFKRELGISPNQLIIEERLRVAKRMMRQEGISIKETAYSLGFSSTNYFTRIFKKNEGVTPKQYIDGTD